MDKRTKIGSTVGLTVYAKRKLKRLAFDADDTGVVTNIETFSNKNTMVTVSFGKRDTATTLSATWVKRIK